MCEDTRSVRQAWRWLWAALCSRPRQNDGGMVRSSKRRVRGEGCSASVDARTRARGMEVMEANDAAASERSRHGESAQPSASATSSPTAASASEEEREAAGGVGEVGGAGEEDRVRDGEATKGGSGEGLEGRRIGGRGGVWRARLDNVTEL